MPLARLCNMFEEVAHSTPEVLVDDEGWMFAQRCEARWSVGGSDQTPVGLLIAYRSVMVRDTWELAAPLADTLLGARSIDVLGQGFIDDPQMMRGRGEYLLVRYTDHDEFPEGPFTLDELRCMISSAVGTALGEAGVVPV